MRLFLLSLFLSVILVAPAVAGESNIGTENETNVSPFILGRQLKTMKVYEVAEFYAIDQ